MLLEFQANVIFHVSCVTMRVKFSIDQRGGEGPALYFSINDNISPLGVQLNIRIDGAEHNGKETT